MPHRLPNLALIGPPGAGKGSQALSLVESLGYLYLSTGDLFRRAIAARTELGLIAEACLRNGKLVPDELASELVVASLKDRLQESFLLDGFPRTLSQAKSLDHFLQAAGSTLDLVFVFVAPRNVLLSRIAGRVIDPTTNRAYHMTMNPPPASVAGRVVRRIDDDVRAAAVRIDEYESVASSLVAHYSAGTLALHEVDAAQSHGVVKATIETAIKTWVLDQIGSCRRPPHVCRVTPHFCAAEDGLQCFADVFHPTAQLAS